MTTGPAFAGTSALQALYEIAVLAADGRNDPAAVARLAAEHATHLLHAEAAAIFAWDARAGVLQPVYETPSAVQEGPARPGEGMVGRAFESLAPVVVGDYQAYVGAMPSSRGRGMHAAMAVPMLVAGRPTGVLGIWTYQPRDFSEDDIQLLALFAAHVAPAFEAARVAAARDVRDRTLSALNQVALAAATVHEANAVAKRACESACELLDAESAFVVWYEPERDVLEVLAVHGDLIRDPNWHPRPGEGIAGAAFQQRRPVFIADYPNWPGALADGTERGVKTTLAVPLVLRDVAVGAMAVSWMTPRPPAADDIEALTLLAAQVGADIETMRLLESRAQQVRSLMALQEVAVAASGVLDAGALARLAVDRARDMLGVDTAVLRWWDPDREVLRLLATNDSHPGQHVPEVTAHQGVVGVAFRNRRHAIIENYDHSSAGMPWAARDGVATALGVPLMVGQQAVGAMAVATYRPHVYNTEQIRMLQLLAGQIAPALEAARLAEERERHLRNLSVLARLAASAGGELAEAEVGRLATEAVAELFDGATAAIAIWDPESGQLMTIWDGQPVRRPLIPGEGAMGQAFQLGETVAAEDYPNWPHATPRTVELGCKRAISVPMLGPDGPIGVLGVRFFGDQRLTAADSQLVQLVTAQVTPSMAAARLHSDLGRSARRLQGVYDAMASGVIVFDRDAKIVEVNDAGLHIFGVERSQLDGRLPAEIAQLSRITTPGEAVVGERPYLEALRTGKPVRGSAMGYRRPDGTEFWVQFDAVPVLDGRGSVEQVISSFIDITSVKSAELANRENEAKSRFLASMSHELRTPLNSILGFAQLLEQQSFGDLNDRQTRYVGHISASGQHLLQLVNDILDLSKVAAGQMALRIESVPVEATVTEVLARLRPMADGRKLWVTSEVSANLVARADQQRVEQVLFNLLSNAIKFTPEHGSVAVDARRRSGHVLITVRDTGLGITADQHARIFEEFTQVDDGRNRTHEGTGLGLPLSKRLVELMSGRLTLRSEPGRGSEFSFTLPLA